jgi:hypothetical protein
MVNLVDEALRGPLFERPAGFAAADVIVADPAVGTGTFLLGVLRRIALTVSGDQGAGAVRGAIEAAAKRVIGFELQFGPFAVAQLRIIAEKPALMATPTAPTPTIPDLRLFITDTLGNPFIEEEMLGQVYEPIAKSRRVANTIKKTQPITVVIGNPPYKEKAEGRGGWIEAGSGGKLVAPLDRWRLPPEWGVRASEEPVYLFLALGHLEGLRLRQLCNDRISGQGRRRDRLFHHCRWVPERLGLREDA